MDNETIRTLITAISAVLTTGTVAFFGWLSLDRSKRIEKLKRDLISTYRQFGHLYECEAILLSKLEDAEVGKGAVMKVNVRKEAVGDSEQKIDLTSEQVKTKIAQVESL
jgi:hypothetical protein